MKLIARNSGHLLIRFRNQRTPFRHHLPRCHWKSRRVHRRNFPLRSSHSIGTSLPPWLGLETHRLCTTCQNSIYVAKVTFLWTSGAVGFLFGTRLCSIALIHFSCWPGVSQTRVHVTLQLPQSRGFQGLEVDFDFIGVRVSQRGLSRLYYVHHSAQLLSRQFIDVQTELPFLVIRHRQVRSFIVAAEGRVELSCRVSERKQEHN